MSHNDPFPSTRWSLLEQARGDGPEGRRALATVLDRYLPALGAFLIRNGKVRADRVDDLLQAFVMQKLLEEQSLIAHASPKRGRFRSLLLTSLNNFLISHMRHEHAQLRDTRRVGSIENVDAPADCNAGPAQAYEIEWARALLAEVARRMQKECESSGRQDIWGVFECRLLAPGFGQEPTPYEDLAKRFNVNSPLQAMNILVSAKRMYARILRQVVAEYESDSEQIDAEIADLREILSGSRR